MWSRRSLVGLSAAWSFLRPAGGLSAPPAEAESDGSRLFRQMWVDEALLDAQRTHGLRWVQVSVDRVELQLGANLLVFERTTWGDRRAYSVHGFDRDGILRGEAGDPLEAEDLFVAASVAAALAEVAGQEVARGWWQAPPTGVDRDADGIPF